jgi:hypothetical protein
MDIMFERSYCIGRGEIYANQSGVTIYVSLSRVLSRDTILVYKDKAAAFFGTPMTLQDWIGLSREPHHYIRSVSGHFNYVCFAYTPFNGLRL